MQNDLISRDFTVKALREYAEQKHAGGETELANGILKAVCFLQKEENVPTAYDVEKVVAEWKYSRKEDIATCKSCSYEHYLGTYHQYATNFCPNCGAKMNGGKE